MKKFFIEDKSPLKQKIYFNKNKKKYISFPYISFLFISFLLILNFYYSIKIFLYLRNRDIKFLKSEKELDKNTYKYQKEEGKEQGNKNKKINKIKKSINFNDIENTDLNIFKLIENKIKDIVELTLEEQKFFHGLIRKIKPKKIVEIGVSRGGSSVLILNAIKDIKHARLFSIDKLNYCYKNKKKKPGYVVEEKFPELMNKWTRYIGTLTSQVIENIGNDIDLVFIDTMHTTPGEMLDWLMVLPFLKNEAIVVFHDIYILYNSKKLINTKTITSNNQLICYIRGELILPLYGNKTFNRNIGALKLAPEQKNYYYQYFLALAIQWEYMPSKNDIQFMRDFFMKNYGQKYIDIFDEALEKNKIYLDSIKK
jgi:predicted O-methyltransferase YrrM